jgi:hypothetical protein
MRKKFQSLVILKGFKVSIPRSPRTELSSLKSVVNQLPMNQPIFLIMNPYSPRPWRQSDAILWTATQLASGWRRQTIQLTLSPAANATDGEGARSPAKRWWPAVLIYTNASCGLLQWFSAGAMPYFGGAPGKSRKNNRLCQLLSGPRKFPF